MYIEMFVILSIVYLQIHKNEYGSKMNWNEVIT